MKGLEPGARVRRLVLDISPLMTGYLLFQAVLGLFLDFIWVRHPFGNPMLLPGVLLALNGSMIAPKVPLWRTLPVTARDIDRARWWHSVGVPASVMALLLAVVNEGLAAGFAGAPTTARVGDLRRLLGIPDEVTPVGVIPIGHQAEDTQSPSLKRGRKPVADFAHYERW